MRKTHSNIYVRSAVATLLASSAIAISTPAFAQDAGEGEDDEQEEAHQAEAHGVEGLERVLVDLHRVDVQEDVVHHRVRARTLVTGVRLAEDRSPDGASADRGIDALQEAHGRGSDRSKRSA